MSRFLNRNAPTVGAFVLAILIFVLGFLHNAGFASASNLQQLMSFATFIGLAALGQFLVVLAGGIDMSVPWVIGLAAVLLSQWTAGGTSEITALLTILVIGALIGLINGIGVAVIGVAPIIMTLGIGGMVEAYLLYIGLGQSSNAAVPPIASAIASDSIFGIPILAIVWLGIAVVFGRVLGRTAFGRNLYAVGTNDLAARLAGVRTARVRVVTYVICGVTSAFAGIVLSGYVGQAFNAMGGPYLFASIAAVALGGASILGGSGKYWGTVAGALTLTFLTAILPGFNLGESVLRIVYGLVILGGVALARLASRIGRSTRALPQEAAEPTTDMGEPVARREKKSSADSATQVN